MRLFGLENRILLLPIWKESTNNLFCARYARIAQLVERNLAKVEVASSNLVSRSKARRSQAGGLLRLWIFGRKWGPPGIATRVDPRAGVLRSGPGCSPGPVGVARSAAAFWWAVHV